MKPLTVVRTVDFRTVDFRTADFRTAVASVVVVHTVVAAESSVVVAANNSGYWFVAGTLLKHMWVDSWKGKGLAYCALKSCSAWVVEQPLVEGMDSVAETQIVVAVIADEGLVVASSMIGQWLVATDE